LHITPLDAGEAWFVDKANLRADLASKPIRTWILRGCYTLDSRTDSLL